MTTPETASAELLIEIAQRNAEWNEDNEKREPTDYDNWGYPYDN